MPALPPRSVVIAIPPASTMAAAVTSTILSLSRPIACSREASNIGEIAVAALALRKARGARGAFALEHRRGRGPFRPQAVALAEAFLKQDRAPVGTHACLREPGDLVRQRLGDLAGLARRRQALAQADAQALLGRNLAAGQNDVERAAAADDPRQAHRAAVDQRHAPAAAVDPHERSPPSP